MPNVMPLALRHLQLRLRALNSDLIRAIYARREATRRQAQIVEPAPAEEPAAASDASVLMQFLGALNPQAKFCISDAQVDFLIAEVTALCQGEGEATDEESLRAEAQREGIALPLDQLEGELRLSPLQMEAVMLCAAPEFDSAYESLYAFILNDVARRFPCCELFGGLADWMSDRLARRLELGRFGRLRRAGVVVAHGTAATEFRQELRLAPGVFDFLIDGRGHPSEFWRDPDEVEVPATLAWPPHVDAHLLKRLGKAFRERAIDVVGVWGPRQAGPADVGLALAKCAGRPLRRWTIPHAGPFDDSQEQSLREAIQTASALDAILWLQTDAVTDPGGPSSGRLGDALVERLAASKVRTLLTGAAAWQPPRLLAARSFHALHLDVPNSSQRRAFWQHAAPNASPAVLDDLAARFAMNGTEARAAVGLAATAAKLNGVKPADDPLLVASAALDRVNTSRFATCVVPRRGPDDLILSEPLKTQVLEIAEFHRAWPRVCGDWGFGRMMTGPGGIKALFTGEPGTGKTLAAEVIARLLGRPLLKLDLSHVVSKWIGETEKHLDTVFHEAQERDSVLCLDEADALLGKRGEIRQGTDRYANLEVSYLLQRLEDHPGLIVMASNHKANIDPAFMRRFQTILQFPRPGQDERRELWRIAFPSTAPYQKAGDVRFDELARLDMTGAAIVESARTAALLAAKETRPGERATVELRHIADAVKRQYQREAKLLSSRELKLLGEEA
jgi:AAA+ superfamily predicted ATPase